MAYDPYANRDPYARGYADGGDVAANVPAPDPAPAAPSVYPSSAFTIGNPAKAEEYRQEYKADRIKQEKARQEVEKNQQLNIDQMTTLLDQTAASIRDRRSRQGNIPLMTLGANMMGPGNFGDQVGRGLRAMVPAIQQQREADDQMDITLSNLGLKKGELKNAPLKDKLDYLKAIEKGDIEAQRQIEAAQIRTEATAGNKADKLANDRQKLVQKTYSDAVKAAQAKFAALSKEHDYSEEDAQATWRKLVDQEVRMASGVTGIQLNQDELAKIQQEPIPVGLGTTKDEKLRKAAEEQRKTQQMHAQVVAKASEQATANVREQNKDLDLTQDDYQKLYRAELERQLTLHADVAGIQLDPTYRQKALDMPMPNVGQLAGYWPKPDEMRASGEKAGLPDAPPTFMDPGMGAKERSRAREAEAKVYNHEAPKWAEAEMVDKTNDARLKKAQDLIQQNPTIMGYINGRGANVSQASQELKAILTQLEINNVPKGQGQITDFERKLFADAMAQMTQNPKAALNILTQMRESVDRGFEHRQFLEKYYRTYRTLEGSNEAWGKYMKDDVHSPKVVMDPHSKQYIANDNYQSSDIYFKAERAKARGQRVGKGSDGRWYTEVDGKPVPL